MKPFFLAAARTTLVFGCAAGIAAAVVIFTGSYLELAKQNPQQNTGPLLDFTWQLVLLGFVVSAAFFAVPRVSPVPVRARDTLLLAGACNLLGSTLMLIGFSIAYVLLSSGLAAIVNVGAFVSNFGIFLMSWGMSMAAVDLGLFLFKNRSKLLGLPS